MIKILMVIPNQGDATSFYRAIGPFAALAREHEISMSFVSAIDWSMLDMVDFVFLQRPWTDEHLKLAKMCNIFRKPLWVDYDDLLFDVPVDNPSHAAFNRPNVKTNIVEITRLATVVTVSTKQLKDCLQVPRAPLNQRVYVVPNAFNDQMAHLIRPFKFKKHVNWRGTATHMRDVLTYGGPLIDYSRKNLDTTFTFVGFDPWMVTEAMPPKNTVIVPGLSMLEYFEFMSATNPSVQHVPLADSMFNRCKSNIAWIEGAVAGAVCIGPNWPEWKRPGIMQYADEQGYYQCLERLLSSPDECFEMHRDGMDFIRGNLMLSLVNHSRYRIMKDLKTLARGAKIGDLEFLKDGAPSVVDESHLMELA